MTIRWTFLAGLLIAAIGAATAAARADGWLFNRSCASTACPPSCYWCPNDYCAKPMPSTCPEKCGSCDDYCAKPMPTTCPASPGTCDDYCPKFFPKCLPSSILPWYVCGPGCGKK